MTVLPTVPGGFGTILADPPWAFETYSGAGVPTQAADPYTTLDLDGLKALPVGLCAADACALFMWYSGTHTDQAIALGEAWGFAFKRSEVFIWVKAKHGVRPKIGMGHWTRNGAECCALFTRGAPAVLSHDVEQVIFCGRGAHSEKPWQTYELIERLVAGPYLELFARTTRANWQAWGNQVGVRDGLFGDAA